MRIQAEGLLRASEDQRRIRDLEQQLDAVNHRIAELEASIVEADQRHSTTFDRHISELHKRLDSDDRVGELEVKLEAADRKLATATTALTAIRDMNVNGWNPDDTWSRAIDMKTYARESLAQIEQPQSTLREGQDD